jgi:hypothetical protein
MAEKGLTEPVGRLIAAVSLCLVIVLIGVWLPQREDVSKEAVSSGAVPAPPRMVLQPASTPRSVYEVDFGQLPRFPGYEEPFYDELLKQADAGIVEKRLDYLFYVHITQVPRDTQRKLTRELIQHMERGHLADEFISKALYLLTYMREAPEARAYVLRFAADTEQGEEFRCKALAYLGHCLSPVAWPKVYARIPPNEAEKRLIHAFFTSREAKRREAAIESISSGAMEEFHPEFRKRLKQEPIRELRVQMRKALDEATWK